MLGRALLCLSTFHVYSVVAQGECTDLRGRLIAHGLHYVPGPDTCTLCVCDNGVPKVCKAVLCSPPQDCRSFRVGTTCCEFICLDDVVKPAAEGAEGGARAAAAGAAAVVLLTVALVVYRVRRQKRRRAPHADDQRSLTSIGYISGSMAYMGGTCETALAAWKPPGNYLPRGEAPPPYDEVVAQCRAETVSMLRRMGSEPAYHRTYPAGEALRPDEPAPCAGHGYANLPRAMPQMASLPACYTAPLLPPAAPHAADPREPPAPMPHHPHHPLVPVMGFPSAIRLTGSLGAISNRGLLSILQREPEHERPHNVPGFYTNTPTMHTSLHRTIPRISAAGEASLLDASLVGFSRADRSLVGEVRRSFHRPGERRAPDPATGRSMPRNLDIACAAADPALLPLDTSKSRVGGGGGPACAAGGGGAEHKPPAAHPAHSAPAPPDACATPPHQTLPLTVDKPSCVCSYSGAGAPGAEDADDYRNECENCKSASGSRWVLEEGWGAEEEDGTQTLQRRAPPPAPPPPATATLPQPVTKQPRTIMGTPSNWENWFNTIPDSDTESEEE